MSSFVDGFMYSLGNATAWGLVILVLLCVIWVMVKRVIRTFVAPINKVVAAGAAGYDTASRVGATAYDATAKAGSAAYGATTSVAASARDGLMAKIKRE